MRTLGWVTALITGILLAGSCNDNELVVTYPPGTLRYTAYDSSGTPVVTGRLSLRVQDSTHVSGEWDFSRVGAPRQVGPQIGKGTLEGGFSGPSLIVNLNPGMVDNNVFLVGRLDADSYVGTWTYSGYPGVIAQGTFSAER